MLRTLFLLPAIALGLAACGSEAETETAETENVISDAGLATQTEGAEPEIESVPEPEGSLATEEMALGDPDAPLTVTEYASVTCPACAAFHANYFPTIKTELIDPGLVRFVYRELPTGPVSLSYAGSILARCAATDAGAPAYFAVNGALFDRQQEWVYGSNPGQALESIFSQVGLDRAAMEQCLRRTAIKEAIDENAETARAAGVQGTPTLMVDGEPFNVRRDVSEVVADLKAMAEEKS